MKIMVINQHVDDALGGSEIQTDIIASKLKELGHDVIYFIMNPQKKKYYLKYDWELHNKSFINSFIQTIKNYRIEIIYWRYNKKFFLIASLIAKALKVKFIFGISAFSDTEKWIWTGRKPIVLKYSISKKGLTIRYINSTLRSLMNPIKSLWNYLGFYLIDGTTVLNSDLAHKLPVKNEIKIYDFILDSYAPFDWDKPFVLWVASIKDKKNPNMFVKLVEKYEDNNIDFLMVGKIQDYNYNYLTDPEGLPENFYYLGQKPLPQVNSMLAKSLALVHTCDPEGFGNIFMQAWNQSKPTISLYFDPENIIKTNGVGFISGNLEQLVKDVKKVVNNHELRLEMGNRAKKLVNGKFSVDMNVRKLEKFFINILNQ